MYGRILARVESSRARTGKCARGGLWSSIGYLSFGTGGDVEKHETRRLEVCNHRLFGRKVLGGSHREVSLRDYTGVTERLTPYLS